jgi:hypothetical protein
VQAGTNAGGVYVYSSVLTVSGSVFESNQAVSNGGGIQYDMCSEPSLLINTQFFTTNVTVRAHCCRTLLAYVPASCLGTVGGGQAVA